MRSYLRREACGLRVHLSSMCNVYVNRASRVGIVRFVRSRVVSRVGVYLAVADYEASDKDDRT